MAPTRGCCGTCASATKGNSAGQCYEPALPLHCAPPLQSKHYDWKLRAIKTTLYVAGGMKRAAPELSEDKVLLRALRDFNVG